MYLPLNFMSWLPDFVLFQGVLFGTMLMFLHSKNKRPTFFLGVFVLMFSASILFKFFFNDISVASIDGQFFLVNFYGITLPYFYLYIQRISALKQERLSYWTLLPCAIELIVVLLLFLNPFKLKSETLLGLEFVTIEFYYVLFAFGYSMCVAWLILKWIHSQSKEFASQHTFGNTNWLTWIHWFVYVCILVCVIKFIQFFTPNAYIETLIVLFSMSLVYWVTYKGILQRNRVVVVNQKIDHRELMTKQQAIDLLRVVKQHIEDSKCYVNDKLTIVDLAEAIHIHPKRISFAINSIKGIHFNRYINYFRVGYAKVLLKSKSMQKLSIEGIGMQAGFHSKTTFYSAFKRFEGMTPAKYKTS